MFTPIDCSRRTTCPATYTFDVFSSLDGYGAAGADWSGYWGKQGPELLEHRLAAYRVRLTSTWSCSRPARSMVTPKSSSTDRHFTDNAE
jgi:hypothetical protein